MLELSEAEFEAVVEKLFKKADWRGSGVLANGYMEFGQVFGEALSEDARQFSNQAIEDELKEIDKISRDIVRRSKWTKEELWKIMQTWFHLNKDKK